ncbi:carboxymuconolactone decarboxylase family protein [Paenibacillus sp. BC26]|uniref:carboxymuconolactone decarboxylase family protein n=1 Tax=Paenibacillus sp. BC26 TaxID=1881032 RepID=UPI0008E0E4FF|nr:carboxymuconolactone decarboxylase family protein [Paenibacillus sp. BC26]SFS66047.1 alkylhydroperoxidase AhpD family core domain-containing protein [Paenibacillus sp. BC26]
MTQRVNYMQQSPEFFKRLIALSGAEKDSAIEKSILDLIHLRASQMNGCGFCVDMHSKEAKIHGERELRLYHLPIWRESTLFSPRERAALEWTEILTKLPEHGVSDEVYNQVREHLSDKELSDLTFSIMAINAWNRISIGFKSVPGSADEAYGLTKAGLS